MNRSYCFDIAGTLASAGTRPTPVHLAIQFYPDVDEALDPLRAELLKHLQAVRDSHPKPDNVVLVLPADAELGGDSGALNVYRSLVGKTTREGNPQGVAVARLQVNGELQIQEGALGQEKQKFLFENWKSVGLLTLLANNNGVLVAPPGYYYNKDTNLNSITFVRAAEIAPDRPTLFFTGACLLQSLARLPPYIYCDTVGLFPHVLSAVHFINRMSDHRPLYDPTIESFSSYAGLQTRQFSLDHSLFLISATVSGGLPNKILTHLRVSENTIVTLIGAGDTFIHVKGTTLAHFVKSRDCLPTFIHNKLETLPIKIMSDEERNLLFPIPLRGESFLPSAGKVGRVLLRKKHVPNWIRLSLAESLGTFRPNNIKDQRLRDYSFNPLHNHGRIFASHREALSVFFKDVSNVAFVITDSGERALELLASLRIAVPALIAPDATILADDNLEILRGRTGPVVVLSCGEECPRWMNQVNQKVRDLRCQNDYIYLGVGAGFDKNEGHTNATRVLSYRNGGEYPCHFVRSSFLPTRCFDNWRDEAVFLKRLPSNYGIAQRLEEIERVVGGSSTAEELFLPDVQGNRLHLRPNFALIGDIDPLLELDCYDVFLVFTALLQNLRHEAAFRDLLPRFGYYPIISPANFTAYNEGLPQASLLRAARPTELNYAVDDETSEEMAAALSQIVASDGPINESIPELILALATKRMTLKQHHVTQFAREVKDKFGLALEANNKVTAIVLEALLQSTI